MSGFAASKAQLAYNLLSPVLYVFIVGFGYLGIVNFINIGGKLVNYVLFVTPGIITVQIMSVSLQTGMTLFLDRQTGMFDQLLACPFSRRDYVLSKVISIVIQGLASGLFVLLIGIPILLGTIGSLASLWNLLLVIVSLTMTAVFFGSIMLTTVTFIRSVQKFNILFNTLYLPIMFLSSAFYPLENAPKLLSIVALGNPLTYSTDLLRSGLLDVQTSIEPLELVATMVLGVIALVSAFIAFNRVTVEQ